MAQPITGPWSVEKTGPATRYVIIAGDYRVATTLGDCDAVDQANAALISAAPELLEALKNIVNFWRHNDPKNFASDAATDAIAAIAKAEGKC